MGARFGLWGRFPMVMGGGKPRAQAMYETMQAARGAGYYSTNDNDAINVDLQANAHVIDCAMCCQERAMLNGFPGYATDFLTDWEKGLGRSPDPTETPGERRATLDAILAGNGEPTEQNILNALSKILPGESIMIIPARAPTHTFAAEVAVPTPALVQQPVGQLSAGVHKVGFAFEDAAGMITPILGLSSITLTGLNRAILVGAYPLGTIAGSVAVHYYLSVAPNSLLCSYVASTAGEAVTLSKYPTTPESLPLYNLGIKVSTSVFNNPVLRQKIDAILGPMLSGWTTYEVIVSSPFILDGSPFGMGAF